MSRGKPGPEQLALSMTMLDTLDSSSDCISESGLDCRNYGGLAGIDEARRFFAEYMGVNPQEVIVAGSSSLNLMYDCLCRTLIKGVIPRQVPGYDRHFAICEFLGIEMINVPMNEHGVDMDAVEELTAADESIKGIWIVPKFSNPSGITYADEVIRRLASFKPAAEDFRIFCDNAYAYHYVYSDTAPLNMLQACKEAGNPDRVYMFGSTNKITLPGAGVAFFAASEDNARFTIKQLSSQAISWDKMNMLRHVRYLRDIPHMKTIMDQHAELLRPKFDIVVKWLEQELDSRGIGSFNIPAGGYFIIYLAPAGCAKRIVQLCKEAGLTLTEAGAAHPYHRDPEDRVIRIAPSFPGIDGLDQAMELFCLAVRIAALQLQ